MSNNSVGGNHTDAGAGVRGGHIQTASAQFQVGAVGFGPMWTMEDSMAASIVRLECEAEELRAEVALLREQARIITAERDEAREALADIALMDTSGLAAPAVCRALRSLGQWKDILDAKTTQDLRQSM